MPYLRFASQINAVSSLRIADHNLRPLLFWALHCHAPVLPIQALRCLC
jgi:hypothetical protein